MSFSCVNFIIPSFDMNLNARTIYTNMSRAPKMHIRKTNAAIHAATEMLDSVRFAPWLAPLGRLGIGRARKLSFSDEEGRSGGARGSNRGVDLNRWRSGDAGRASLCLQYGCATSSLSFRLRARHSLEHGLTPLFDRPAKCSRASAADVIEAVQVHQRFSQLTAHVGGRTNRRCKHRHGLSVGEHHSHLSRASSLLRSWTSQMRSNPAICCLGSLRPLADRGLTSLVSLPSWHCGLGFELCAWHAHSLT